MAEDFYSMQDVMGKLNKTEQEVQELVKQGKLRQYMDAGNPMFKVEDINSISEGGGELDASSFDLTPDNSEMSLELEETSEIELQPDESGDLTPLEEPDLKEPPSEGGFGLSQIGDLTMGDTNVGTVGINILTGTEDAFKLTEDTKAETQSVDAAEIEEIESLDADANMESFGSGSGLLDLSLQADDTSLGAVLDDILPTGAEDGAADAGNLPTEDIGLVEETEDLLAEPVMADQSPMAQEPAVAASAPQAVMPMGVVQVDPRTNLFGIAMFLPLAAIILLGIIITAVMQDVRPSLLNMLIEKQIIEGVGLFWVILGALAVIAVLFCLFASLGGGSGKPKAAKVKKAKKEKPKKKKKEKKKKK